MKSKIDIINAHAGGSGNVQFQNIPAGSYRLFVRNTDYSGVPAYENSDLFPYISFNAIDAMNSNWTNLKRSSHPGSCAFSVNAIRDSLTD